jgi:hypothetical protein
MHQLLLAFALVFFVIGTFATPKPPEPVAWYWRFNPISAGLACWVATLLLTLIGVQK